MSVEENLSQALVQATAALGRLTEIVSNQQITVTGDAVESITEPLLRDLNQTLRNKIERLKEERFQLRKELSVTTRQLETLQAEYDLLKRSTASAVATAGVVESLSMLGDPVLSAPEPVQHAKPQKEPVIEVPKTIEQRKNDQQKRDELKAAGWVEHEDIRDQNIREHWERGERWYSLKDAWAILCHERNRELIFKQGWRANTFNRWFKPGERVVEDPEAGCHDSLVLKEALEIAKSELIERQGKLAEGQSELIDQLRELQSQSGWVRLPPK